MNYMTCHASHREGQVSYGYISFKVFPFSPAHFLHEPYPLIPLKPHKGRKYAKSQKRHSCRTGERRRTSSFIDNFKSSRYFLIAIRHSHKCFFSSEKSRKSSIYYQVFSLPCGPVPCCCISHREALRPFLLSLFSSLLWC